MLSGEPPMRIYLAAAYERNAEMRGVRDVLQGLGHTVTSRWIDQAVSGGSQEGAGPGVLNTRPDDYAQFALKDLQDIDAADTLVMFTGGGRGGRHTEFGYALGRPVKIRLVVVGDREHVFHALPGVEWYPDWARMVMAWSPSPLLCEKDVTCDEPE